MSSQTYFFLAASLAFLESEPLDEVLEERTRNYLEHNKPIDFHYIQQPAFLQTPEWQALSSRLQPPLGAVISTDRQFIEWLRVRLAFVEVGSFVAPSPTVADPLAVAPTAHPEA